MIDYHIHTPLCNHAVGEMREYVEAAVKKGLVEICFLDHLIVSGSGQKNSMSIEGVSGYYDQIQILKEQYQGLITISAGLEVDFDPENVHKVEKILNQFSFDAIGGSVHFVDGVNVASRHEAIAISPSDERILVRKYFEALNQMLEYRYFDFICHFDVIKKTGRVISEELTPLIDNIISKIAKANLTIEFNTSGWDHPVNECYPSVDVIKKCVDASIPFVLSSDAHKPEDVGKSFDRAATVLSAAGCKHICSFGNRKRRFRKIDWIKLAEC